MRNRVVVTYAPDEEERESYRKCLGDLAPVAYLENLSGRDRRKALGEANVIISYSFSPEEIRQGDIPCMMSTTFIQLIFSGADNAPFALIPEQITVASNPGAFAEPIDLIDYRELEWMKRDAILINVARGGIVNQKALYEHMKANPDFRVGIDTWWSEPSSHGIFTLEHPFFELQNLIGSPHIADHVPGIMPKATKQALENVKNYLLGKAVHGVVKRNDYVG